MAARQAGPSLVRAESGVHDESLTLSGELTLYAGQGPGTIRILTAGTDTISSAGVLTLSRLEALPRISGALAVSGSTARRDHCGSENGTGVSTVSVTGTSRQFASPWTAGTHASRILKKLQLSPRTETARACALRNDRQPCSAEQRGA